MEQCRGNFYTARKELLKRGGFSPARSMRDRQWNNARLKYCVAKERLDRLTLRQQRHWEQEREYGRVHEEDARQCLPTIADSEGLIKCLICHATIASNATLRLKSDPNKGSAWWERPNGLADVRSSTSKAPQRQHGRGRARLYNVQASQALITTMQIGRAYVKAYETEERKMAARKNHEFVFRRKHDVFDLAIADAFWENPLPGLKSYQVFQRSQKKKKTAGLRARGHKLRTKPPSSPLSQCEYIDEVHFNGNRSSHVTEREKSLRLLKEIKKVAAEVGYLYFVGIVDGGSQWREDIFRSREGLVIRFPNEDHSPWSK